MGLRSLVNTSVTFHDMNHFHDQWSVGINLLHKSLKHIAHSVLEQNTKSARAEDTKAYSVTLSFIILTASCMYN